ADARERLDLVGTEARPVVLAGDDDGRLDVAEGLHLGEGVGVLGDVDDVVGQARLVQRALGRIALHAEGLRVHGDVHGEGLSRAPRRDASTGVSLGVQGLLGVLRRTASPLSTGPGALFAATESTLHLVVPGRDNHKMY